MYAQVLVSRYVGGELCSGVLASDRWQFAVCSG